jgi:hypothetical protein
VALLKVLGEDTEVGTEGVDGAGVEAVEDVEAGVVGWAWVAGMDMVREGLSGQTDGIRDFMGHARTDARALETEHGVASTQEWGVTIVYSQMTASGAEAEAEADGGR